MKKNFATEKETQQFLKVFLDNLPYPIFVKRAKDGGFVYWNKAEEDLVGISAASALNKTDFDIVPKAQAEFFRKMDMEVFKKSSVLIIPEEPLYIPHLGRRILRTVKTPIYDENNEPLFLLGISQDVTEAKKNEEELKKYCHNLENLVRLRTSELKAANAKLEKHQEELQAANSLLKEHQNEIEEVNTLLEEQKEELLQQKEELQTTLENLQKTQEQLIESEKLSALGGLVAGVAHEINTPVGIGVTAVSNLQEEIKEMASLYKKDEISRKDFKEFLESANDSASLIHKNLERTAQLIQSFKQVSVDQVSEQQRSFNFKSYLEDIIRSLSPKFKHKDIKFNLQCDEELLLNSFPGAYAQVFTNLLLNSFTHGFHDRQQGKVTITAKQKERRLEIEYRDDGNGISSVDLPHIFEPFFTSDQHKGTGLGLNIVYNIVKQKLHGSISCKSIPGKGVLFMIELPITT